MSLDELVHAKAADSPDAVETEAAKGYSIAFVGTRTPISETAHQFEDQLQRLVQTFEGPVAIVLNATAALQVEAPLSILVPTGGTAEARLATEMALAVAKASGGVLTALHVFDPREDTDLLRGRARRLGMSVLVDARRLGRRSGVRVRGITTTSARPEVAIRRVVREGRYDLVVIGTSLRQGERKFLGPRTAALLRAIRTPVLLIAR
jgi:nucleotide-binding universal stress UspA family protein